ncbi:MAG: hypothetical protein R2867_01090 [Caldilineaceae bacterium]
MPSHLRHVLSRQRTLLIVDNLETVEEKESVLAFLYDLPPLVKVIITTRERYSYTSVQLGCLDHEEGMALIELEAERQHIQTTKHLCERLYQGTGGIPAAIIYGVGQLAAGRDLPNVLTRLADHEGDIARFFFQDSVTPLRGRPSHQLLMAIAIFDQPPLTQMAVHVAGLNDTTANSNEAAVQLLRLSHVHKVDDHFVIHPLTREYTLAELHSNVEFEVAARNRWVAAYRATVETIGCKDQEQWHDCYRQLEAEWNNLHAVIVWLLQQRRYDDLLYFWQHTRGFMLIYGHMEDQLTFLHCLIQRRNGAVTGAHWRRHFQKRPERSR